MLSLLRLLQLGLQTQKLTDPIRIGQRETALSAHARIEKKRGEVKGPGAHIPMPRQLAHAPADHENMLKIQSIEPTARTFSIA
jgi:hypothetical protein